jgi:hypothetical protein
MLLYKYLSILLKSFPISIPYERIGGREILLSVYQAQVLVRYLESGDYANIWKKISYL